MNCLIYVSTLSVILLLRTTTVAGLRCGPLDIALVVDSSTSIQIHGHDKTKESVIGLLDSFEYGSDKTRVSLMQFGRGVYAEDDIEFDSYGDKWENLKEKISNLVYRKGTRTDTGAAIEHMVNKLMKKSRDIATPVAIVITDGNSQDYWHTVRSSKAAKEAGIIMFCIGVGQKIKQEELENIATQKKYIYHADSYEDLAEVMKGMIEAVCKSSEIRCFDNKKVDVMFAIDTSGSIKREPFAVGKAFLVDFVKGFRIESNDVRVATNMFSSTVHSQYNIDFGKSPEDLYKTIADLKYLGGGTNTNLALEDLRLRVVPQLREGVRHIAVVMTDGTSRNNKLTVEEADKLRMFTDIIAVGIGANVDHSELLQIAGDEKNVVLAKDYDHLKDIRDELMAKVCPE